jgi:N-acylneuraminate cytidylyltransferase
MPNLAIIPARGGSKRIPKKNIKDFIGLPIISYSIKTALSSGIFDEIMVSTDDEEIAQIALDYGAKVPFMRSNKNSSDVSTTYEVIEEVLMQYKQMGLNFSYVCCLYPCAPFITPSLLRDAYWKLQNQLNDLIFVICQYSSPIQRAIRIENNKAKFISPEFSTYRTQDFEKKYFDAGQFYFFKPNEILKYKKVMIENAGFIIVKKNQVEDIDDTEDWIAAETKFKLINNIS